MLLAVLSVLSPAHTTQHSSAYVSCTGSSRTVRAFTGGGGPAPTGDMSGDAGAVSVRRRGIVIDICARSPAIADAAAAIPPPPIGGAAASKQ